jgi:hypothetical protein
MAHFTIPEEAETALYGAERALALMESTFATLGEAQFEGRCDELAAIFGIIREKVAVALTAARWQKGG